MITKEEYEATQIELCEVVERSLATAIANSPFDSTIRQAMHVSAHENALSITRLIEAIVSGRDVFCVCESYPKYAQQGGSYYSLYFVKEDFTIQQFSLLGSTMKLFGAEKEVYPTRSLWVFPSHIIGLPHPHMARNLDAFEIN